MPTDEKYMTPVDVAASVKFGNKLAERLCKADCDASPGFRFPIALATIGHSWSLDAVARLAVTLAHPEARNVSSGDASAFVRGAIYRLSQHRREIRELDACE